MKKLIATVVLAMSALGAGGAAYAQQAAPAGSPAAPAPEFPWLYIAGGVIVVGGGIVVYRMAKQKATPAKPPLQRAAPARAAPPPAPVHVNFDANDFLRQARASFIRMQAAWDKADTNDLGKFTTPQVFAELKAQIGDRPPETGSTDVVEIQAELLGVEPIGSDYVASVKFKGSIKPAGATAAEPFAEVWNMTRAINANTGWKLSGIQQLS